MKKKSLFLFLVLTSLGAFSQEEKVEKVSNKGKMFIYWGWNRANYSTSDISFRGYNYNFTLQNVVANERTTEFSLNDYINPLNITNPQTNVRIGYFLNDHYSVSVGVDHMKYVVEGYQTVKINGEINAGTRFDGVYNNDDIRLSHDFLQLEHTDGLNYVNVEVKRFDEIGHWIGMNNKNFQLNITEGFGAGFLYPRTDAILFNQEERDEFQVSGWGISAGVGLNLTFFKYFFFQSDLKYGYINMPNIQTTPNEEDKASQSFTFLEKTFVFGAKFNILKNKK
ncbi:hypothetical protein [uncultured Polaribacter sp.]|uniref:hypothetical protein n=1 Tax=uncultured Polaribacter sp. TaxID=174711 RepID=UPI002609187F|nr:hypothetical protein [uncultured Polaribacter sp.]